MPNEGFLHRMGRLVAAGIGGTIILAIIGVGLSMAGVPMEIIFWVLVVVFIIMVIVLAWAGIQVARGKKTSFD